VPRDMTVWADAAQYRSASPASPEGLNPTPTVRLETLLPPLEIEKKRFTTEAQRLTEKNASACAGRGGGVDGWFLSVAVLCEPCPFGKPA
jgi:hypothetical protein